MNANVASDSAETDLDTMFDGLASAPAPAKAAPKSHRDAAAKHRSAASEGARRALRLCEAVRLASPTTRAVTAAMVGFSGSPDASERITKEILEQARSVGSSVSKALQAVGEDDDISAAVQLCMIDRPHLVRLWGALVVVAGVQGDLPSGKTESAIAIRKAFIALPQDTKADIAAAGALLAKRPLSRKQAQ